VTELDTRRIGPSEQAIRTVLNAILPGSALVSIRRMTGSFTNDAYGVEAISGTGTRFRVVVRRYAPFGGDRSAKAKTEFHGLGLLHTHGLPVPEPLYLDEDGAVLGAPAIVMSFLPGHQVLEPPDPLQYARRLTLMLVKIHAVPFNDADREFLLDANADSLWFLKRKIIPNRIAGHELGPDVWRATKDLAASALPVPAVVSHCDFQPGNILWAGGEIAAVIDWEEAGYADPGLDLAYTRMDLTLRGMHDAAAHLVQVYEDEMGHPTENLALWELAAGTRLMPDPAFVAGEWTALGAHRCTPASVRENLKVFIEDALRRR